MVRKFFISNKWRYPKVIIVLFFLEFAFTVPVLALFAVADPDTYRTKLREDGYENGFNSNPQAALYAAANYQPYSPPIVWSTFITGYNVVIAVFSTFLLLIKAVMFILHIWWPGLSFIIHGVLTALWAVSTWIQSSPDLSDPQHPQYGAPWYITKSCSISFSSSNIGWCQQAKASFIITVIIMCLFAINCAWAIWSLIPTKQQRLARQRRYNDEVDSDDEGVDDDDGEYEDEAEQKQRRIEADNSMEMQQFSQQRKRDYPNMGMKNPTTPRTTAFNRLGGNYYS